MGLSHLGGDVAQWGVQQRTFLHHDDFEVYPALPGTGHDLLQTTDICRWRGHPVGGDVGQHRAHAIVDRSGEGQADGATDLNRYVGRRVQVGHNSDGTAIGPHG